MGNTTKKTYSGVPSSAGGVFPQISAISGQTQSWAQAYTNTGNSPAVISGLTVSITPFLSNLLINGVFSCKVVSVIGDGSDSTQNPNLTINTPDTNNVIATATNVPIVDNILPANQIPLQLGYFSPITFSFDNTIALNANQKVFYVVTFTAGDGCTITFSFTWTANGTAINTYMIDNAGTITLAPADVVMTPIMGNATYITQLELPADCDIAVRIGNPNGTAIYLPMGTDAVMYRAYNAPVGTFYNSGYDTTTKCKTVTLNTQFTTMSVNIPITYSNYSPLMANYFCDYIAMGGTMSVDTDEPVIPLNFRDMLVWGGLEQLYSENLGIPYSLEDIASKVSYWQEKLNEKFMPQHQIKVSVVTGRYTSAIAATRDNTLGTSLLQYSWPNTWQNTFAAAQGIGPMGF